MRRKLPRSVQVRRLVVGVAAVVATLSFLADRADSVVHLDLRCGAGRCSATTDDNEPLELSVQTPAPGAGIGLYAFAPWERETSQAFRNLMLRGENDLDRNGTLLRPEELPEGLAGEGWRLVPGWGLVPDATSGARSVALLDEAEAGRFRLEVDLVRPSDAGVVFHASGASDGMVLVVRPLQNDIFFFRLTEGQPGPVLALAPLRELTIGRELLRLSGGAAAILLVSLLFIGGLGRVIDRVNRHRPASAPPQDFLVSARPPRIVPIVLFAISLALPAVIAIDGFEAVPHVPDEIAYLFQARIFAGGQLWAPAPGPPDFFLQEHVIAQSGRWFAKYPPMFPALLALGVRGGAPWLVNALLSALTALLIYRITRELAGWRWGLVAWLLALTSPFFVIMGGSMMSHSACALFVTLFVWLSVKALQQRRYAAALGAGVALGLALLTRPYTALLAALVVAGYGAWLWSKKPVVMRALLGIAVGASFFVSAFLFWGDSLSEERRGPLDSYSAYHASDTLGFGSDRGAGWLKTWGSWGHTPAKALRSAHQFLGHTSHYLFGWPPMLSFCLVVACFRWGRPPDIVWLLLALFVALVIGHMFYWATQHIAFGARYWFSAVPGLIVLSALGLRGLARGHFGPRCVAAVLAVLIAINLTAYMPRRLRELPRYGAIGSALAREVERRELRDALVFVRTEGLMYNDGFSLNDPFLRRGPIFARDLGERNTELMALHPDFDAYRWDGSTLFRMRSAAGGR